MSEVPRTRQFHLQVGRLLDAGFNVLPLLNTVGLDTGLTFWRRSSDGEVIEILAVWHDTYAVVRRVPNARDWSKPFEPTLRETENGVMFHVAVDQLLTTEVRIAS